MSKFNLFYPHCSPTSLSFSCVQLGYVFYGDYKLDLRCKQWFDDISDRFLTWPEFRSESDERLICARDGIEQYVMQRIGEYAFRSTLDTEGDEALLRRMKLLAFVRPEVRHKVFSKLSPERP